MERKLVSLGCIQLVLSIIDIQIISFMPEFSYFVVPTTSFPSFYLIAFPSITSQSSPAPENPTSLVSEPSIAASSTKKIKLELSEDQLLAAGYQNKKRPWSAKEDEMLLQLIEEKGVPWKQITLYMQGRSQKMCYSRYRRLMTEARHRWAPEQEQKLRQLVNQRGEQWKQFSQYFPNRTWKQIKDKYVNYLRPGINKDEWSLDQDLKILELLKRYGTKWKKIQHEMGNRTDNQIKNRYYGRLKLLLKKKARKRNGH